MLIKLQTLNIFSKKLMIYVLPVLQLRPLRSSTTNTVPKAFKKTLACLHLPLEHAMGAVTLAKAPRLLTTYQRGQVPCTYRNIAVI